MDGGDGDYMDEEASGGAADGAGAGAMAGADGGCGPGSGLEFGWKRTEMVRFPWKKEHIALLEKFFAPLRCSAALAARALKQDFGVVPSESSIRAVYKAWLVWYEQNKGKPKIEQTPFDHVGNSKRRFHILAQQGRDARLKCKDEEGGSIPRSRGALKKLQGAFSPGAFYEALRDPMESAANAGQSTIVLLFGGREDVTGSSISGATPQEHRLLKAVRASVLAFAVPYGCCRVAPRWMHGVQWRVWHWCCTRTDVCGNIVRNLDCLLASPGALA